eukprot:SAG11_NODE_458_length_9290_cov_2.641388_8_plen_88_part_00
MPGVPNTQRRESAQDVMLRLRTRARDGLRRDCFRMRLLPSHGGLPCHAQFCRLRTHDVLAVRCIVLGMPGSECGEPAPHGVLDLPAR